MSFWEILMWIILVGNVIFGFCNMLIKKPSYDYGDKVFGWGWGITGWIGIIIAIFLL